MATSTSSYSSSQPHDQSSTSLYDHASHRIRLARDLARLLSCAQLHDLSAADFVSACEIFDVLLDDGYQSLQAFDITRVC
jgi:hypothetical protein